jgi:hypothetical protein
VLLVAVCILLGGRRHGGRRHGRQIARDARTQVVELCEAAQHTLMTGGALFAGSVAKSAMRPGFSRTDDGSVWASRKGKFRGLKEEKRRRAAEKERRPVLTPRFVWKVKNQCNYRHNEGWYWAASKGVEFEGEPDDTFVWRLHRRMCCITPEMEQPSVVGSSVADGIRSHMQRFGIGMWALYDNRDRAVMNGCGDSNTTPNIHSTLCTDLSVIQ